MCAGCSAGCGFSLATQMKLMARARVLASQRPPKPADPSVAKQPCCTRLRLWSGEKPRDAPSLPTLEAARLCLSPTQASHKQSPCTRLLLTRPHHAALGRRRSVLESSDASPPAIQPLYQPPPTTQPSSFSSSRTRKSAPPSEGLPLTQSYNRFALSHRYTC